MFIFAISNDSVGLNSSGGIYNLVLYLHFQHDWNIMACGYLGLYMSYNV